tara:strand:- start:1361 stop:1789 length:429 start_codon:yes stop_codon:yes gene_type:complete
MTKEIFDKDNPHKDIGKQKFRVRKHYSVWVEYDVVAENRSEAESAVMEHGGIDKIEWQEGYHNDEPVEVYANDYESDYQAESDDEQYGRTPRVQKIAECIPYEDNSTIDYSDPDWSTDEFEWKKKGDEPTRSKTKTEEEIPF